MTKPRINPKNDPDGWIEAMTPAEAAEFMASPIQVEGCGRRDGRTVFKQVLPLTMGQVARIAEKAKLA